MWCVVRAAKGTKGIFFVFFPSSDICVCVAFFVPQPSSPQCQSLRVGADAHKCAGMVVARASSSIGRTNRATRILSARPQRDFVRGMAVRSHNTQARAHTHTHPDWFVPISQTIGLRRVSFIGCPELWRRPRWQWNAVRAIARSLPYICDCGDARAVAKSIEQKKKQMKNSIRTNILVYTYKYKRKHNNEPANGIDLIMMAHCTAALSLTLPTWHCIF